MKLEYSKIINVNIGDRLYGIIGCSTRTYIGVYEIEVNEINWNEEYIVFNIEQSCQFVIAYFYEIEKYVFKTEEEANKVYENIDSLEGLLCYLNI